jgi:FKBP-type peptidyl-prolyl cis-trans isomerase
MKQYLFILGLFVTLTSVISSCKEDPFDALREDELAALNTYITANDLENTKDDATGIYFKLLETSSDTTQIRSGYRANLHFNFTLIDGTALPYLTTEDKYGHNYDVFAFYVDATNVSSDNYIQQIAGLHRALKKMKVGEKAFIVIPSELAFKALDKSIIGISRFSTLLATVTVVSALTPEQLQDL